MVGMKPGPKPHPHRAMLRKMFSDMSDRAFATYWRAYQLLALYGADGEQRAAVAASTRPNGSFNVSKYAKMADAAVMRYVLDHPDEE